jgi:hypothetical protein
MINALIRPQFLNSFISSYLRFPSLLRENLHVSFLLLAIGLMATSLHAAQQYDGPAELPIATVSTATTGTPAQGSIISVNAGGNLQTALNNASCGDVIELEAGATFSGPFVVPAKNCNVNQWIWITSSSANLLPAQGTRATPCYAGVSALEGRPQYSCNNPQNVMATVQMAVAGNGPFKLAPGANFYRFVGLQVTRPAGTPGTAVLVYAQGTADHIIIDRSWLHGAQQDETNAGVNLSGMTNAAVIDSYFSDFHCIAVTGKCTDAQAINGGVSDTQDGPYLIQNNFLEASGEAIMFGGGPATETPTDIEILGNHFWKPFQWQPGNTPFVGGTNGRPFAVKNHLELKNAVRVLVDSNLMENVWGGFSQTGVAILLTPKNQHSGHSNVCSKCAVTDITIRYSQVSHAGGGIQMATALSGNGRNGAAALAGTRWSIHDMVFDDLSAEKYTGNGAVFAILNTWKKNALNTVTINHVTAFPDSTTNMMYIGNTVKTAPMYGLVFTNNLMTTARYPVWNTGGKDSCAAKDVPVTTITKCFTTQTFQSNGFIASPATFPPPVWPKNNFFPQAVANVDFTDFNNGDGGNYALLPSSPYVNKGTDGKNLGADIVGLNAALAGVE